MVFLFSFILKRVSTLKIVSCYVVFVLTSYDNYYLITLINGIDIRSMFSPILSTQKICEITINSKMNSFNFNHLFTTYQL